ncbi:hypothetical protein DCAR_0415394 [Daucus carota subsp. sativus]|uniref:F-box domain-containing protein n=1 Tax=Daucus carota subsp. sativus TaxID=79200 RepID=A0AAF0WUJ6_DAUCS|nr:hypothetical protein DCAR_0415394 [Daucus carota subsp. sativus]
MAESSRKKIALSKEDRISELPLHIQEIILCFLPIQDAVRTSVLSRKWRHCWTTIPNLIFDHRLSSFLRLDRYDGGHVKAIKFVSVVNKLLLLHNGPILKFSFICPMSFDAEVVHDFIDHWIPLFSRKCTKQLILEEDNEAGNFKAHNYSSLDLTHLRLGRSLFPHSSAFGGFVNLIKLELVNVASNFGQTIIVCPALEKLTLICCSEIFPVNFRAPSLKCLHQVHYGVSFEYDFMGLENLTEHSYVLVRNPETRTKSSNVVKVLGSLPKIEKFSTGIDFLKYLAGGGCPNRLSQPPPYLKTLNIWDMNFANLSEISCLLCLIRSAPNLCKLHMSVKDLKHYLIEDFEDCTIGHLEIVTFSNFMGIKTELEVVKFLLGHSPLLKTMCIHCGKGMKEDVALTMKKEIMQYSRGSSRAQIKYLEHPVIVDDFDFELWLEIFEM